MRRAHELLEWQAEVFELRANPPLAHYRLFGIATAVAPLGLPAYIWAWILAFLPIGAATSEHKRVSMFQGVYKSRRDYPLWAALVAKVRAARQEELVALRLSAPLDDVRRSLHPMLLARAHAVYAVSYTHLTLPTILRV